MSDRKLSPMVQKNAVSFSQILNNVKTELPNVGHRLKELLKNNVTDTDSITHDIKLLVDMMGKEEKAKKIEDFKYTRKNTTPQSLGDLAKQVVSSAFGDFKKSEKNTVATYLKILGEYTVAMAAQIEPGLLRTRFQQGVEDHKKRYLDRYFDDAKTSALLPAHGVHDRKLALMTPMTDIEANGGHHACQKETLHRAATQGSDRENHARVAREDLHHPGRVSDFSCTSAIRRRMGDIPKNPIPSFPEGMTAEEVASALKQLDYIDIDVVDAKKVKGRLRREQYGNIHEFALADDQKWYQRERRNSPGLMPRRSHVRQDYRPESHRAHTGCHPRTKGSNAEATSRGGSILAGGGDSPTPDAPLRLPGSREDFGSGTVALKAGKTDIEGSGGFCDHQKRSGRSISSQTGFREIHRQLERRGGLYSDPRRTGSDTQPSRNKFYPGSIEDFIQFYKEHGKEYTYYDVQDSILTLYNTSLSLKLSVIEEEKNLYPHTKKSQYDGFLPPTARPFNSTVEIRPLKTSSIIPTTGNVAVLVKTSVPESIQVSIDLGITKLPIFTLNVPYQGSEDDEARKIAYEGASALLDEMAAFLLERMVNRDVIIAVYASALSAFETLKPESVVSEFFQEEPLKMWEQEFLLPVEFAQEVSRRVITATVKWRLSLDDTK